MIISVSRRTDIPAFYSDWFFNRIKEGFVYVRNPINKNLINKISLLPEDVDCFVFWTKNPQKFINRLSELCKYKYYFQFTINSYGVDIEPSVPKKKGIIESFIKLSNEIGKERVIWRYDPILINANYNLEYHIKYFEVLAKKLNMYTEKCVISFIDLYKKSERNLNDYDIKELTSDEIFHISKSLIEIASKYNLNLETCAETIELEPLNITHNRCIDNVLIERILNKKLKVTKDKNQRDICGCIESVDIGAYNTCRHGCLYCYANFNKKMVMENSVKHSIYSPLIFGDIDEKDIIKERKVKTLITNTLFK